jgi:hypothetical protein
MSAHTHVATELWAKRCAVEQFIASRSWRSLRDFYFVS